MNSLSKLHPSKSELVRGQKKLGGRKDCYKLAGVLSLNKKERKRKGDK